MNHHHHEHDPQEHGKWDLERHKFNYLPVHVALLHTGKVLAFGGSCNDENCLKSPYDAEIWDPVTGECTPIKQPLDGDVFCVGHSFLADGRLLIAGGTSGYDSKFLGIIPLPPFRGLNQAYIFDPLTERWERVEDMAHSRWYPTLITLGDGRVVSAAGLTDRFPWVALRELEVYTPGEGWSSLEGAARWMPLYPRLHLLPNGDIFYAGSYNTHYTFPFVLWGFPTGIFKMAERRWEHLGLPRQSKREEGASILLPLKPATGYRPRVLLVGGGTVGGSEAINASEIIDLSLDTPDLKPLWRPTTSTRTGEDTHMAYARYYTYATILPNGEILVVGGRTGEIAHNHEPSENINATAGEVPHHVNAIMDAEIFNPVTEEWRTVAPMQVDRLYHSNALLMPDGRVMTTGSNPVRRTNELRIEMYSPPYLFKEPRPVIESAPTEVVYGAEFEIKTAMAAEIDEVCIIRNSATTHCLNTDQRYVGLEIVARTSDAITVKLPNNRNLVPPGYYMLFILSEGIPSVAPFVRVIG